MTKIELPGVPPGPPEAESQPATYEIRLFPITSFRLLRDARATVNALPGVAAARARRCAGGELVLEVKYRGSVDLPDLLERAFARFAAQVRTTATRVDIRLAGIPESPAVMTASGAGRGETAHSVVLPDVVVRVWPIADFAMLREVERAVRHTPGVIATERYDHDAGELVLGVTTAGSVDISPALVGELAPYRPRLEVGHGRLDVRLGDGSERSGMETDVTSLDLR